MSILQDYLDRESLAAELHCHTRTVDRLRTGPNGLPFVQIGGRVLFRRETVKEWLAAQERRPNPRRSRN